MPSYNPWQQPKALMEKDVRDLLQINFSELKVDTISALREGWDNTTWLKLKRITLQEEIYDKPALRLEVEGMFYKVRVGCPWRDLPKPFGKVRGSLHYPWVIAGRSFLRAASTERGVGN